MIVFGDEMVMTVMLIAVAMVLLIELLMVVMEVIKWLMA